MFLLTSVRRSPQSVPAIGTLQFRSFCASPPPELASGVDLKSPQDESRSFYKLFSKFALAASIGTIGYYSYQYASSSEKPFAPFANWSTDATSTAESRLDQDQPSSTRFLFAETYRRKIFFNYEKRIRMRSSPEKVFEYFASYRTPEGDIFMTPDDLMRAVVPVFPPSESNLVRDGYLRGERSPGHLRCTPSELFMLFDMNGDGLISFKEYIFFVTLLSIPETSFTIAFKMFDSDCNGEIDREEFKRVMALMRAHNRQGAFHSNGRRPGMKVDGAVEDGGLVEYFFGEDGKKRLEYGKFVNFLKSLHDEMVKLEFAHYDYKLRGTLSAKDFGLSIVASADMRHLSKLLDRVEEISKDSEFGNVRITFEEFKSFADLRKQLQSFSLALFTYGKANGLLSRDDFQRAASQVCGISLTDNVVDIIFHIFDTNRDGSLSSAELLRVLHKRESDIAHPTEAAKKTVPYEILSTSEWTAFAMTTGMYNASLLLSSTFSASFTSHLKLYPFPLISRSKLEFSRKPASTISCSISPPEENGHKISYGRRVVMLMGIIPVLPLNDSSRGTIANAEEDSFLVEEIKKILTKRKAAGILRLVFHDAGTFEMDADTGGMNGSIIYELDRPENRGLEKSVKILQKAKEKVDRIEPVSWADMIAVAGAEAVFFCGGPKIPVRLGRIDASLPDLEDKLPSESLNAIGLKQSFQKKGFTTQELVVLSGAHTLGSKGFGNPNTFDNSYFKILLQKPWSTSSGGMGSMIGLPSDRALVDDNECLMWISKYADNEELFFKDFKKAYIKLVDSGAKWKTFL